MSQTAFTCTVCGKPFTVKPEILARYPGWVPRTCMPCRQASSGATPSAKAPSRKPSTARKTTKKSAPKRSSTLAQVLERYTDGPVDGVFTDGACSGNPGPGGWGVVHVKDDQVVDQRHGHEASTTNNRMELSALIAAYEMLPDDASEVIWTDSNLCVQTLNQWAAGWARRGWKRKTGPVQNLDLVKRAYALAQRHPNVELRWLKGHGGLRWNEYADALATAFQRDEL